MTIDISWNGRLKVEIVTEIARLIGVSPPHMSTGSTEPREIFDLVNSHLGLGIDPRTDKSGMARAIVEASGGRWAPDCESRGATITRAGLVAVLEAVQFFVRE
jgi:hypothetical protein